MLGGVVWGCLGVTNNGVQRVRLHVDIGRVWVGVRFMIRVALDMTRDYDADGDNEVRPRPQTMPYSTERDPHRSHHDGLRNLLRQPHEGSWASEPMRGLVSGFDVLCSVFTFYTSVLPLFVWVT